jgi:hypothetical protein
MEKLTSLMREAGFANIQIRRQHSHKEESLSKFLDYASQRYRTSQLIALADNEYEEGISKLKEYIVRLGNHSRIPSEICLVWVTGDKPK